MFLLDTNVISGLRRRDRADPRLLAWADSVPAARFFLSAVTILELELGVLLVARRDRTQGDVLKAWVHDQILPHFQGHILPVDSAVALRCAALHVPDPRSDRDALIGATAAVHGLTVATRNVADFQMEGVSVFNPWEAGASTPA